MNNVLRHEYKALTEQDKAEMKYIKDLGLALYEGVVTMEVRHGKGVPSRETSLAKTKIEEAIFWATKHITRPE